MSEQTKHSAPHGAWCVVGASGYKHLAPKGAKNICSFLSRTHVKLGHYPFFAIHQGSLFNNCSASSSLIFSKSSISISSTTNASSAIVG
jgi:hypothetical protein